MKKRSHRLLAVLLAASMVVGQGNFSAWAEGETTVQAEAAETAAAETPAAPAEAPTEKATEAPTEKATEVPTEKATEAPTEKATEAPTEKVTEAPTEKPTEAITEKPVEAPTEAPAEGPTETPTEAPAEGSTETPTEAPAEEPTETPTEAPSEGSTETPTEIPGLIEEVTEAGTTEAPTEKAPEELTEEGTDKETETESETAEKTTFTFSGNGMKVTVKLEKKNALPGTTQFSVKEITKKSSTNRWKKAQKLVANQVNQGHRRLAEARFYELSFLSDGKTIQPAGKMTVKMEYSDGLSLGLAKYAQGEAAAFAVGDSGVQSLGGVKLNASLKAAKAELTLKNQFLVGIAGIQNRQNDGSVITGADLESGLGEALNYAVVANRYDGPKMEYAAAGKGTPDDRTVDSAEILDSLSEYSLTLANGKSSDSVNVVNIYADKDGTVDTEPLEAVMSGDGIDVSEKMVVVNVVAASADQQLSLPVYAADFAKEEKTGAGRVVYNIVAEDGKNYTAYTGSAVLEENGTGTYLAPEGSVDASAGLLGAVYADQVQASDVTMAVIGNDGAETESGNKEDSKKTDAEDEETSAGETENASEAVTEAATEAGSETVSEGDTEAGSETVSEGDTESGSETVSEGDTEAGSETISEGDTESGSETVSEGDTEAETETETDDLIQETEVETEEETDAVVDEAAMEGIMALAAPVAPGQLMVTKTTGDNKEVVGAVLALEAAEDIVPVAAVTIKNQEGQNITYEAGKVAFKGGEKPDVIYQWTTQEGVSSTDISPYLIPGGSYRIREISAPEGYANAGDLYFTVDEKNGTAKYPNGETITGSLNMVDKEIPTELVPGETQELFLRLAVQDADPDANGGYPYLDGAEFVVKDADGKVLVDKNGNPYTFVSEENVMTLNFDPELYEALTKDMENDSQRVFRVAEIRAKAGYQFTDYSEAAITLIKDENGQVTLVPDETYTEQVQDGGAVVIFKNKKISQEAAGTISATVRNYFNNSQIYATSGVTHYVALFADKEKTNRNSDVRRVEIKKGYKSATVRFERLPNGTYYVGETDQYGNLVGTIKDEALASDGFYTQYLHNGKEEDMAVIKTDDVGFDIDPELISINNHYFKMPENFVYTASFQVTLELKDENGGPQISNSTFYAGIYTKNSKGKYGYIGKKALKMGGKSSKTVPVEISMSTATKSVMVKLVDANGKEVVSGANYKITVNPAEITLTQGDTQVQTVTITYARLTAETETDPEVDLENTKAELKLTKKVMYKKTPIRVNSVYYIGIFDDAELTKLRYKKAMTMANASELTATLKVNLNKLASKEVTFYFAEVDENGKVLKGGKEFGYDISLNKDSVTLNSKNMADEVVVTNSVIAGGNVASQLADPGSGLAGDPGALATAQNLASDDNSSDKTATGDSTPILPLAIVLVVCAVVIVAVVVQKRRHRNR